MPRRCGNTSKPPGAASRLGPPPAFLNQRFGYSPIEPAIIVQASRRLEARALVVEVVALFLHVGDSDAQGLRPRLKLGQLPPGVGYFQFLPADQDGAAKSRQNCA